MSDRGEQAISLLTKLAYGDLALVRDALSEHGDGRVDDVIAFIIARRLAPMQVAAATNDIGTVRVTPKS